MPFLGFGISVPMCAAIEAAKSLALMVYLHVGDYFHSHLLLYVRLPVYECRLPFLALYLEISALPLGIFFINRGWGKEKLVIIGFTYY